MVNASCGRISIAAGALKKTRIRRSDVVGAVRAPRSTPWCERESGTTNLEAAVAACEACLTVTASVWPTAWVEWVQSHIDQAHAEIATRYSSALTLA